MSCGGGGSSQSSQSTAQLDPQIKQAELDWYGNQQKIQQAAQGASLTQTPVLDSSGNPVLDANGNPTYTSSAKAYTPYTDQKIAGLSSDQQAAINGYQSGSYQPGLSAAMSSAQGAGPVSAGSLASTNLSPYLNPYTQDVTNSTINDFNHASQLVGMNSQQAATAQGAFGGSGQGVFQANNQDNLNRTLASTLSGLNQANFTNAQTQATNDLNRSLQAQEYNGNLALQKANTMAGIGMDNLSGQTGDANNLMNMGNTQQQTNQNQLDWNYQNNYYNPNYMQPQWDVQMANAGQGNMPNAQTLNSSSGDGASGQASC